MKTKFTFSVFLAIGLLICGNIAWAQGRGNGRGQHNQGNGNRKVHEQNSRNNSRDQHHHHYDNSRNHSHHDDHYHEQKVVYVYHHRPVERVVVHQPHHVIYEPRYVYYREYDVYYDNFRKVYISFSGRNWSVSTAIPVRMYYADRGAIVSTSVNYYEDDLPIFLDTRRPGGRHCDEW